MKFSQENPPNHVCDFKGQRLFELPGGEKTTDELRARDFGFRNLTVSCSKCGREIKTPDADQTDPFVLGQW